jgi:trans-aconitate methyltransferase
MPSKPVPDRVRWLVELLAPSPGTRVLEVGGGPGVAAQLVCDRLGGGRMTLVDRSATALRQSGHRNAKHLMTGRLELVESSLADFEPEPGAYDLAFSINVNVFWAASAERELAVLHEALAPGGRLAVAYGAASPGRDEAAVVGAVAQPMEGGGVSAIHPVRSGAGSAVLAER